MDTQDFRRKLTAIFSADVAGYSRLMGEDEAGSILEPTWFYPPKTEIPRFRGLV